MFIQKTKFQLKAQVVNYIFTTLHLNSQSNNKKLTLTLMVKIIQLKYY